MQAFKIFVAEPKWRKFLYKSGGAAVCLAEHKETLGLDWNQHFSRIPSVLVLLCKCN